MKYSKKWKIWKTILDLKTCLNCFKYNGKIYAIDQIIYPELPLHPNCRCVIERLKVLYAGTATNNGVKGADWYLRNYGKLTELLHNPRTSGK